MYLLNQICDEYLQEQGLPDNAWNRAYTLGTSCLRELGMDISTIPKYVELPINQEDLTTDLPSDFMTYISVNVTGQDGQLYGLGKNLSLNLKKYYNDCGVPQQRPVGLQTVGTLWGQISNPTYLANHWRNGENFGAYFNIGGHNNVGGYLIDYATNQIKLTPVKRQPSGETSDGTQAYKSIILVYIADLDSQDNDYMVHPYLVEAVKNWIYWKWIQRDRNMGLGEKQVAEQSYWKARRKAVHRYSQGTAQEWLDSMRKGNSGTPRW